MGTSFSFFFDRFAAKEDVRVLMIGLDAAGKTTTLYQLKLGATLTNIPTIGFNVEILEYKRLRLTVWDIGGQKRVRSMWRYYYNNAAGVIFVVDAADVERFPEAMTELHSVLRVNELKDSVVLVFANKQDLPHAIAPAELALRLRLDELQQRWKVHGVSAANGHGVLEGMELLYRMIRQRRQRVRRERRFKSFF
ncbi:ADP-ribosylation factor-like [Drosophila novamexicana]|uniref:ADP-ribosylation factor-like n=1 Tax=Drosophila novamexicana TaxID=47314 RepID=UPI0011E5FDD3|nr:ADP-ribosylation factor-like [Drosophila novamexicana]